MPRNGGLRLLRHMLSLTGKKQPTLLVVPTPLGDDARWIEFWQKTLGPQLDCDLEMLRTFGDSSSMKNYRNQILGADAIFVTGGNTLNALAIWKAHSIDVALREAWERGIVLGGESAGMICWFEQGLSDSRPEKLSVVDGLGFLPGSCTPHLNGGNGSRRAEYERFVTSGPLKSGYGCDDGTALVFEGTRFVEAVTVGDGGVYRFSSNDAERKGIKLPTRSI